MLLAFGTYVSGGSFHVSLLPKIKECEDEYPHQIDEMPIQARNLHGLIAPLAVIKSSPYPKSYHSQVNHACRYVQAVETGEHEGIAEEEDPHHRLAPGDRKGLLIGRPVGDDSRQAFERWRGVSCRCQDIFCHTNLIRGFRWTTAKRTGPATPAASNASRRYTAPRSRPHPAARRRAAPF